MSNKYWYNICKIADKQRLKGLKEYGQGIEQNNQDITTRINYLEEELVDALMYCEWIKEKLNEQKSTNETTRRLGIRKMVSRIYSIANRNRFIRQ